MGKICRACLPLVMSSSVFTVVSKGASWRLSIHQLTIPASSVINIVRISMCCCMRSIGANASLVGSTTAKIQDAAGMRISDTSISTPRVLNMIFEPSSPAMKRSMSVFMPGAGRTSIARFLSVAAIINLDCGAMIRKPPVKP